MKNNTFRSVTFWKSAFVSMPDNSFFELMRSVFGKIKTPFNKQHLLKDLEGFLQREDIQNTIASYIDENDAKIIAAIALFEEPVLEQLVNFFHGEYSHAQLHDIIVNMEERFIVYRFMEERFSRLALNPVLKNVLLPFTTDTASLFPIVNTAALAGEPASDCQTIFSDLLFAGFLSFVSQWDTFYKTKGIIRKRVIDAGKTCFPGVDLNKFTGSLLILGLFYIDTDRLVPDKNCIDDFCGLSARERCEYYAAALLICSETSAGDVLPPLFRSRVRGITGLIHSFLNSLESKSFYPETTLLRIIEILKVQTDINVTAKSLLEVIIKTGLIVNVSPELKQLGAVVYGKSANNGKPVIAFDSGFSFLVYPEINITDVISLNSFLNIKEIGLRLTAPVARFELDKNSAIRAYDNNITADEIIELLNRLSGKQADENLVWNLKDWEKRHGEVKLKKGVVLCLSEEHQYLTKTRSFAALIIETLAPGLYLLDENAMEDAANALKMAGIDIVAQRKEKKKNVLSQGFYYPAPASTSSFVLKPFASDSKLKTDYAHKEKFIDMLSDMSLSDAEIAELSARIDRRLILCETQLKEANLRYEKLEARLMDYTGKMNIAKQAITQKSPVEIIRLTPGLKRDGEKIFGLPKALEKKGDELFLVVDTMYEQDLAIPLAKISLLRRIKKSIFEI